MPTAAPSQAPTRYCIKCAEGYGVPSIGWFDKKYPGKSGPKQWDPPPAGTAKGWPADDPHGHDGSDQYHGQVCVKCVDNCASCDGDPGLCNRCADGYAQQGTSANTSCVKPTKSTGFIMLVAFSGAGVVLGCMYCSHQKQARRLEARRLQMAARGEGAAYKALNET